MQGIAQEISNLLIEVRILAGMLLENKVVWIETQIGMGECAGDYQHLFSKIYFCKGRNLQ